MEYSLHREREQKRKCLPGWIARIRAESLIQRGSIKGETAHPETAGFQETEIRCFPLGFAHVIDGEMVNFSSIRLERTKMFITAEILLRLLKKKLSCRSRDGFSKQTFEFDSYEYIKTEILVSKGEFERRTNPTRFDSF